MRSRPLTWLLLSVMLLLTGVWCWRLGDRQAAERLSAPPPQSHPPLPVFQASRIAPPSASPLQEIHEKLLRSPATQRATRSTSTSALRLTNTPTPLGQLLHRPTALLLGNALLDTAQPLTLPIPDHLRAGGDPGAYVIQSRAPLDDAFRARLEGAGAVITAYVPNRAYLVRASVAAAQQLRADPLTRTVLPYEPYFKLQPPLLALAVAQQPLPEDQALELLLFSGADVVTRDELDRLGVRVVSEEASPFGPVLTVQSAGAGPLTDPASSGPAAAILPALARIPGVQGVGPSRKRVPANDLSRARIGVATDSVAPGTYLNLTGSNVLVSVCDSGVDTNHPDLLGRVFCDVPTSGVDSNGHGTHVAGIIAGSGSESATVTNASGSMMPAVSLQFRGQAPSAQVFAITASSTPGPASDTYLQETAARNNALISNNSWHYANDSYYDLAAARYDAATRDALPGVSGSQPVLFVFGAGNAGSGEMAESVRAGALRCFVKPFGIAQLREEIERCEACETRPCRTACPADCSPADFIMATATSRMAIRPMADSMPTPCAVRICPACTSKCSLTYRKSRSTVTSPANSDTKADG